MSLYAWFSFLFSVGASAYVFSFFVHIDERMNNKMQYHKILLACTVACIFGWTQLVNGFAVAFILIPSFALFSINVWVYVKKGHTRHTVEMIPIIEKISKGGLFIITTLFYGGVSFFSSYLLKGPVLILVGQYVHLLMFMYAISTLLFIVTVYNRQLIR